jgi:acyl-CoA hydrolase
MPKHLTIGTLLDELKPGMTVYVPGMSGESTAFYDALKDDPGRADGIYFVGVLFPGINRSDFTTLSSTTRQRAYFMTPALRTGVQDGRVDLLPLDYAGIYSDLQGLPNVDLAIIQVTPPDSRGFCSLGVTCDFQPAVWRRARRRIAHVNHEMPRTSATFEVRLDEFDAYFEQSQALPTYDTGAPDEATLAHGRRVAELIRDGDVLEFGVGKLQSAILSALSDHRGLQVWSGMASTPISNLIDSGALAKTPESINVGVALGDRAFYDRVSRDHAFRFRPVNETHNPCAIGRMANFCAVNSAVEVDLFGQVNADCAGSRLVAGVGGLPAFASGALLSQNGRSIIALPAATESGRSRIVSRLSGPGLAALPRHCADWIVTEHGAARLRGLSIRQRALALIGIAAPEHRGQLEADWQGLLRQL